MVRVQKPVHFLYNVVMRVLGYIHPARFTLDADLRDDLRADSLDMMDIVLCLERRLRERYKADIIIPDRDVEQIQTVRDLCRTLMTEVRAHQARAA